MQFSVNSIEKAKLYHICLYNFLLNLYFTPNKWLIRKLDTTLKPEAKKKIQDSFCPVGFAGHVDNDCQEWDISVNESNPLITVFRGRKNKHFKIGSMPMSMTHSPIKIYDFNF